MAANNLILAVPSANSSVNYNLPESESAKLSFTPEDIDGLRLDGNGGLVISFVEGGNVTITNFESFIQNGNTLSLADGTQVDPKTLFTALGGQPDNAQLSSDIIKIGVPAENAQNDITLESGKKYLLDFDLSQTTGADVKDGKMVIGFANGGKIVINNYETAMADKLPPELNLNSKTCVVTGDQLITNIQKLAQTETTETVVVAEEKTEETKPKSKIDNADMAGLNDVGPGDQTKLAYKADHHKEKGQSDAEKANNIETAAGDADVAKQLASIETAAGGGAAGGRANSGYGFGSSFAATPFATSSDIGPINPTALNYQAPRLNPSVFLATQPTSQPPVDSNPIIARPDAKLLDETNLSGGPLQTSGHLNIDFGADGPGSVGPNNSFNAGGSLLNGALTSHGVPVDVSVSGNGYVGYANGVKVFELTIDPQTGDYTYTQYETLDHANGSDPNDQITLDFGVIATDADGDPVTTNIQIVVADDAPTASGAVETVDETNLGPIVETGSITINYGEDGPGHVETTNAFDASGSMKNGALTTNGIPVVVTATPTGYVGMANGEVVFKLDIDPSNGHYTYTQYKNLDHADNNDPNDIITLTFGTKVVDYDGDSATANIVINIKDDAPVFQPGGPTPDNGIKTVDETNLGPNTSAGGTLHANFGADQPGSYAFQPGSFTSSGSKLNGQLTHEGVPVVVTLENGVYVGKAGSETIFTLTLDPATGDYNFTLFDNLDHANPNDPNDVITLDFGVVASDSEGDSVNGSIRINVKDDAPVAHDDVNTFDTTTGIANGNVITGLNGGAGAQDHLSTDANNTVTKISFGSHTVDVPTTGTVSIDGDHGTLTIAADGTYTYTAFDNNGGGTGGTTVEKTFVSGPALPDFDEGDALDNVEQQSLGIAPGNLDVHAGDVVTVKFNSEGADYTNTLGVFTVTADGKIVAETVLIKDGNTANQGDTFSYTAATDAASTGFFLIANGSTLNNGYEGIDFSKGTLDFVYKYGTAEQRTATINDDKSALSLVYTDGEGHSTVLQGPVYFTSDRGDLTNLNADGTVRVVSGIPEGDNTTLRIGFEDLPQLGDKDYNDMVFDISITNHDCGCGSDDIQDVFTYTLTDGDGDSSTATLTLNGQDLTDVSPIFAEPADKTVDETNLAGGTITQTGTFTVDFGVDGPGTVGANGAFTSSGSKLNGALTSGGVPVVIMQSGNTYYGKAGTTTVFSLEIKADGSYTFKLFEQLDHADGTNPNDVIDLHFGVNATDCDGDVSSTTLTVHVKDDAPVANDDHRTGTGEGNITGNVIANDVPGQDTPAYVTKVQFEDVVFNVPTDGTNLVITTNDGILTINKFGDYTYDPRSNEGANNQFVYTLSDADGDKAQATLSFNVEGTDTTPVIVEPATKVVDETNLAGGTITQNGTVSANYFNDGPGTMAGNNVFASSGSRLNNALTSGGTSVVVTYNNGVYTGKAGTVTVFTLSIAADGAYTFKLFEQLDHADGSNPNDIIHLDFGIVATDADGDHATSTIRIDVKDDAPIANDDHRTVADNSSITGNVVENDTSGQDTPAYVTKVQFEDLVFNVPTDGSNLVITTADGRLEINKFGEYRYDPSASGPNGDSFVYTLTDADGDSDTAVLSIDIQATEPPCPPEDDTPVAKDDNCTLFLCDKTLTSNVLSNDQFGNDGPGHVVSVTFGGVTKTVPTTGTVSIATSWGTLVMAADGHYTYTINHAFTTNQIETFTVKVADTDGDVATSKLNIGLIADNLDGTSGEDVMHGTSGDDAINGLGDDDWLWGEKGNDTIHGNDGHDDINGGDGNDALYGDAGDDILSGREGNDTLYGGDGKDSLYGDAGVSATYAGDDKLYGEAGDDYIYGGAGKDYINGGIDNDTLYGGDGNDTILGGAGNDHIIGEKGNDILTGGNGADTFWFMAINEGVDTIKDFNESQGDKLELSNVLTQFDPVTDAINNFVFAQTDASGTTILVNQDGSGGVGAATALFKLEGVSVSVSELFNHGNLIT